MEVAAGIAGLIALADMVFGKVFWYTKATKSAEKDVKSLLAEIRDLSGILHSLHLVARQLEPETYDRTIRVHHIHYCHEKLESIKARLQKAFPTEDSPSTGKILLRKLKWPFSAIETQSLVEDIQRQKETLSLALSTDNLSSLLKALSRQAEIGNDVKQIKQNLERRWIQEDLQNMAEYQRKVLEFFTTVNPQRNYDTAQELRHPGTGLWWVFLSV